MPLADAPIVRVAARGEGVTADGRHAALAAPGDTLTGEGVVIAGPHHQLPPCRHFPVCGGCQLQHLDDASWAHFLTDRIAGALAAHELSAEIRPPLLSPPRSRRRATLHAERRDGRVRIGFSEAKSHALVDLIECWVLRPELFALVAPLRRLLGGLAWKGRATIDLALLDQGVDLLLSGVAADDLKASEALAAFAEQHRLARLSLDPGYGAETRWEPAAATITLGGIPVGYPPAAFLQATAEGEAALVEAVREATAGAALHADLFAGLGTFALALPGKV
ncbi:MAG: class I SAM-dependent RNA methyltransferase, partial [Pseudomonadota bacterium]